LRAGGEELGIGESLHPHLPIFAAHHRGRIGDLLVIGGLDRDGADDSLVGIDRLIGVRLANRFEDGLVDGAGGRMGTAGRGERVDDEIDLAKIGADEVESLTFDVGGKSVAVEVLGVEAGGAGGLSESDGVIPAGAGWAVLFGGTFKEDAKRGGTGAESGSYAGCEAISGGSAEHEDLLRAAGERRLGFDVGDPLLDVRSTTGGVGGDANEATDFRFNDHRGESVSRVRGWSKFQVWFTS